MSDEGDQSNNQRGGAGMYSVGYKSRRSNIGSRKAALAPGAAAAPG